MYQHIPALFNANPVLKFNDLSVDSPMGRFALKMEMRLSGEWDEAFLQNPAMMLPLLKLDLETSLPRSIVVSSLKETIRKRLMSQAALNDIEMSAEEIEASVKKTVEQQLGGLIAQGFIKENAAQLETHIAFEAGTLSINGMDASALMGSVTQ